MKIFGGYYISSYLCNVKRKKGLREKINPIRLYFHIHSLG
jgi:hypothetical protein